MYEDILDEMIDRVEKKCMEWVGTDENGNTVLNDPIEHRPIGAHYAMSHFAAGLTLLGIQRNNKQKLELGIALTEGVLNRWKEDTKAPDFHYDFNHMALCLIHGELFHANRELHSALLGEIERTVLLSPDSPHLTVNWLPMRIYVNGCRYLWTKNDAYQTEKQKILNLLRAAQNKDGLMEDRLPKKTSYNLQYNIATVALLAFLNEQGEDFELSQNVEALLALRAPDGDVNYFGRGCNQVFGWAMWLYLLRVFQLDDDFKDAIRYLRPKLERMLDNNNIFLNEFAGEEQSLWWDYHYASVYTAHLFLWLVLARYASPQAIHIQRAVSSERAFPETGVHLYRSESAAVSLFSGRKEYLAERGPVIGSIWHHEVGMMMKGAFGPWMRPYGFRHALPGFVPLNYFGPVGIRGKGQSVRFDIRFPAVSVNVTDEEMVIDFACRDSKPKFFNMALLSEEAAKKGILTVFADGREMRLFQVGQIQNQYGPVWLFETAPSAARLWEVRMKK